MANQHAIIFKIFSDNSHVVKKAQFLSSSASQLLSFSITQFLNYLIFSVTYSVSQFKLIFGAKIQMISEIFNQCRWSRDHFF